MSITIDTSLIYTSVLNYIKIPFNDFNEFTLEDVLSKKTILQLNRQSKSGLITTDYKLDLYLQRKIHIPNDVAPFLNQKVYLLKNFNNPSKKVIIKPKNSLTLKQLKAFTWCTFVDGNFVFYSPTAQNLKETKWSHNQYQKFLTVSYLISQNSPNLLHVDRNFYAYNHSNLLSQSKFSVRKVLIDQAQLNNLLIQSKSNYRIYHTNLNIISTPSTEEGKQKAIKENEEIMKSVTLPNYFRKTKKVLSSNGIYILDIKFRNNKISQIIGIIEERPGSIISPRASCHTQRPYFATCKFNLDIYNNSLLLSSLPKHSIFNQHNLFPHSGSAGNLTTLTGFTTTRTLRDWGTCLGEWGSSLSAAAARQDILNIIIGLRNYLSSCWCEDSWGRQVAVYPDYDIIKSCGQTIKQRRLYWKKMFNKYSPDSILNQLVHKIPNTDWFYNDKIYGHINEGAFLIFHNNPLIDFPKGETVPLNTIISQNYFKEIYQKTITELST